MLSILKKGALIIICIIFANLLLAQDEYLELPNIIPPSPNAFELCKYGQLPVGLFSGTINVEVPLFTYKARNITIPLSLSYNSNGIKVDEIASVVGLGWNLNAGGVISRIVRDEDDQDQQLFFPEADITNGGLNNAMAMQYFHDAAQGNDSEPDLYLFNFPGHAGQFVFDNNNTEILTIPAQALRIETCCEGSSCGFRITTPDGLKYVFMDSEITESRIFGQGHSLPEFVENAWYLTSIIHPNGDEIYFHYSDAGYFYISGISESIDFIPTWSGCDNRIPPSNSYDIIHSEHFSQIAGKRLVSISSNIPVAGEVLFSYNQNDPEIGGYDHLSKIAFINGAGNTIESVSLSYLSTSNKRIFLQELVFRDPSEKYAFEYYDPALFPGRLSYSQDHWGYFNNKPNTTLVPKPDNNDVRYHDFYHPADRKPDFPYAQYGLLKKVTYPTKGSSEITYEPNTYYGNKIIPGHTDNLNLAASTHQDGPQSNSVTVQSVEDQYIEIFVGVCVFDDPDPNSPCWDWEPNGHELALLSIHDNTAGVSVNLVTITHGLYWPRGDGSFYPGEENHCYAKWQQGHSYTIEIMAMGKCTDVSAIIYYIDQASQTIKTDIEVGGSRVKRTVLYSLGDNQPEITRYFYGPMDNLQCSSGDPGKDPVYLSQVQSLDKCAIACDFVLVTHDIINSSSILPLFASGNSNICYKYVSISNGGDNFENGGSEHTFIIDRDYPGNQILGNNSIASAPWPNLGWDHSLEMQVRYFHKNETGDLMPFRKTENYYTTDPRLYKEAFGYAIRKNYDLYCSGPVVCTCTEAQTHEVITYWVCTSNHKHVNYIPTQKCISFNKGIPPHNELRTIYPPCYNKPVGFQYINTESISNLDVMSYKIISWWKYMNKSVTTDYDLSGQETLKTEKNYTYDNADHMQLTQTLTRNSKDQDILEKIYYPDDVFTPEKLPGGSLTTAEFNAIGKLKKDEQYRIGEPVQKELFVGGNRINTTRFLFGEWHNLILPSVTQTASGDNLLENRIIYNDYNENGNLLQVQKNDNIPVSLIYGYNNSKVIAEIQNATIAECGYTGFENHEASGWQTYGDWRIIDDVNNVKMGKNAIVVNGSGPAKYFTVGMSAGNHSGYKASVWVKGGTDAYLLIQVNDDQALSKRVANPNTPAGSWNLIGVELPYALYKKALTPAMKIKVCCGSSATACFDDLRFCPMDARMTTYTFDPIIGMTSVSDLNNKPTTYEYDGFGRLKLVRDFLGNILKKYDYHFGQ